MGHRLWRTWAGPMIVGLAALGMTWGCHSTGADRPIGGPPLRIVTTVGMVTDMVREVVGDRGEVIGLLGEGVDPHLYKPTANDVKQLTGADIVFFGGLMLEGRMQGALEQIKGRGRAVHAVTDDLDRARLLSPPAFAGHYDPHVWMDVGLWSECVESVARRLADHDPSGAEIYARNAGRYRAKLAALDDYVRRIVATIPVEQRVLVTAHDAFGYFSRAYGIHVESAQGISTESEPGVNDINALVDFIVGRKVKAIFIETSVAQANLRAVVEGAASREWPVAIGGSLYSDAMGSEGTYEGTYIGMIDHNATTIVRALGGDVPPGGLPRPMLEAAPGSAESRSGDKVIGTWR